MAIIVTKVMPDISYMISISCEIFLLGVRDVIPCGKGCHSMRQGMSLMHVVHVFVRDGVDQCSQVCLSDKGYFSCGKEYLL